MIVFLSNGAGEDAIAARIAEQVRLLRPNWKLAAFPLIGAGAAYPVWMQRLGSGQAPPSGGLSNESWKLALRDLRSGWLGGLFGQLSRLRALRGRTTRLVAVGDLVPVLFARLAGLAPTLFVGTAKSIHHHRYSAVERWILKRCTDMTLTRDPETAQHLFAHGLPAQCLGNAMMDELGSSGAQLPFEDALALFPGSRESAYAEMPRLLALVEQLGRPALVALAPSVEVGRLGGPGWTLVEGEDRHLVATLEKSGAPRVGLVRGALGDVLERSLVALGQAGTANEQAAGAGVPVVAIHERGSLGWYRGRQKGLLGDALEVVPDAAGALAALRALLANPKERQRRGDVGRARMGPPGGAKRMAHWIVAHSEASANS